MLYFPLFLCLLHTFLASSQDILSISTDKTSLLEGETVTVSVTLNNLSNSTIWPFLNNYQWGADQPLIPDENSNSSKSTLLLPIPNTGTFSFQVAILKSPYFNTYWTVGELLPTDNVILASNVVEINVEINPKMMRNYKENKVENLRDDSSQFIIYWEPWFTEYNIGNWELAEAIPLVGRYSSFNLTAAKQHLLWFNMIGITGISVDWTNNLWNIDSFNDIGLYAQELINSTTLTFNYYNELYNLGYNVPRVTLLLGLDNGPQTSMNALYGEINYITKMYYEKFKYLFIELYSKPLLTIFDGGNIHGNLQPLNNTQNYTLRWVASQLQSNNLNDLGYYSWMDGSLQPMVTYNVNDSSIVEAITITNAFFTTNGGWLSNEAYSTKNGGTLLEEGNSVSKYSPLLIFICQWNEFAGQSNSNNSNAIYVDIYNSTLGNDMEPTSLTQCGYNRPNNAYCGGWGYKYLNIMNAIIYNLKNSQNTNPNYLFLKIGNPVPWSSYISGSIVSVYWYILGNCGSNSYSLFIDSVLIANVSNVLEYDLDLGKNEVSTGYHNLSIVSNGCVTPIVFNVYQISGINEGSNMTVTKDSVMFLVT